jgi:hypothetical protein
VASKKKTSKKRRLAAAPTATPTATLVYRARELGYLLIGITKAWTDIRAIAQDELNRLAGK